MFNTVRRISPHKNQTRRSKGNKGSNSSQNHQKYVISIVFFAQIYRKSSLSRQNQYNNLPRDVLLPSWQGAGKETDMCKNGVRINPILLVDEILSTSVLPWASSIHPYAKKIRTYLNSTLMLPLFIASRLDIDLSADNNSKLMPLLLDFMIKTLCVLFREIIIRRKKNLLNE